MMEWLIMHLMCEMERRLEMFTICSLLLSYIINILTVCIQYTSSLFCYITVTDTKA
jgi:hypothetical protein